MADTAKRLARAASLLRTIDLRRTVGDPRVGSNIERMLVDRELRDLEEDIVRDPGALAGQLDPALIRRRRG